MRRAAPHSATEGSRCTVRRKSLARGTLVVGRYVEVLRSLPVPLRATGKTLPQDDTKVQGALYNWNLMLTAVSTVTGLPFSLAGSYFHCESASNAACRSAGGPLITRICATLPVSSTRA